MEVLVCTITVARQNENLALGNSSFRTVSLLIRASAGETECYKFDVNEQHLMLRSGTGKYNSENHTKYTIYIFSFWVPFPVPKFANIFSAQYKHE